MGATQQAIQVALRYDGKVFVPDRPFDHMPPGTVIKVWTSNDPADYPEGYFEPVAEQIEKTVDSDGWV